MTDIRVFIAARLDEEARRWKTIWRFQAGDKSVDGWWDLGGTLGIAVNTIIDTTRGGRDVAAKRSILAEHEHVPADDLAGADFGCKTCHYDRGDCVIVGLGWCSTIRHLAAPYADHPDFDPAWRVTEGAAT